MDNVRCHPIMMEFQSDFEVISIGDSNDEWLKEKMIWSYCNHCGFLTFIYTLVILVFWFQQLNTALLDIDSAHSRLLHHYIDVNI
jgi:hypothetical protein